MSGSKVDFLFVHDFCRLIGQESQRPSQEAWLGMSLDDQQKFVLSMAKAYLEPPQAETPVLEEPVTLPSLDVVESASPSFPVEPDVFAMPVEFSVNASPVALEADSGELPPVRNVAIEHPSDLPQDGDLGSVPEN